MTDEKNETAQISIDCTLWTTMNKWPLKRLLSSLTTDLTAETFDLRERTT